MTKEELDELDDLPTPVRQYTCMRVFVGMLLNPGDRMEGLENITDSLCWLPRGRARDLGMGALLLELQEKGSSQILLQPIR